MMPASHGARLSRRLAALGMLCVATLAGAGEVTSTLDDATVGTLRNQVAAGGTVTFAASLAGQTITLTRGEITVPAGTTISGPGAGRLTVSTTSGRLFHHLSGAATIAGLTLANGNAGSGGQGGAVRNLATLTLADVAITASRAGDAGGAVYNAGSLTITGSTFNGNSVTDATCAGGGAIRSEGSGSQLQVTNSTITGNSAASCSGGGISFNDGSARISASTIAGNSAGASGGNLYKGSSTAPLVLEASIVAQGSSGGGTPVNADLHGAMAGLSSSGYNLVQSRGDSAGWLASDLADGTDPLLGALAANAGATPTRALLAGSPARDAMPAACVAGDDQRGFARPQGAGCDIGAFEYRHALLGVTVSGDGRVSAGATPAPLGGGITDCTGTCTADYDGEVAPSVTLAATAAPGHVLVGWGEDCAGAAGATAVVAMTSARSCTVTFAPNLFTVTPSVGSGSGTISPAVPQDVQSGTSAVFVLGPAPNWHIAGVGGTCGGTLAGNVFTTAAVTANCTVVAEFAIDTHTVTPTVAGGNGTISPATAQVLDHGATAAFTLTPDANHHIDSVTGTCGGILAGNVFTTAAVTADCTVVARFAIDTHVVTPAVSGGNGSIAPSTPQTVDHGATTVFTLTPDANHHVDSVTGTCGGTLAGNVFTTAAVTADCTVVARFAIDTYTVTPSIDGGNGSIAPSTPQTVDHGATTVFTLTPDANHHVDSVTGTCGGTLAGNVFTTDAVTADCTVVARFAIDTYTITPSIDGGNGSIAPSTPQTVDHGATTVFTLTPDANHHVDSVTGTCGGTLAGNVFTTAAVTADCTVVARFAIDTYTVTPGIDGGNGSIAPSTPQTVDHGATIAFTLTPDAGYHVVAPVGGSCPAGDLAQGVYTTGAITDDCTVVARFAIDTHTIGGSVTGLAGTGLALELNGMSDLVIGSDGPFVFPLALDDFTAYAVRIATPPADPVQVCTIANGSGTLGGEDVTDVEVTCQPPAAFAASIDDGHEYARYGSLLDYLVTVTNGGGDAHGITVTGVLPPQLDAAATTWICLGGTDGASCGSGGSGGFLDAGVSIPAGGSLSWLVTAPVLPAAAGATVDFPVVVSGPVAASASDSDILVILRNGFQTDDDGSGHGGADRLGCRATGGTVAVFDPAQVAFFDVPPSSGGGVDTLLAVDGSNRAGFRVERLDAAGAPRVRLVAVATDGGERAGDWSTTHAGARLAVAIATPGAAASVLLEGADASLSLALASPLQGVLRLVTCP